MESRHPDLTRQRILDSAFAEIHRQGFQAASIANILADTGLTKGALYHHFPDKKSLGLAVVDERIGTMVAEGIIEPVRSAERPVLALLDLLDDRCREAEERIKLGCPLNNLMQEMSPVDEEFRTRLNRVLAAWQDAFDETLRRAQKTGEVRRDLDCRAAALFIVSAWEGCIGVAKNMQSVDAYCSCLSQLQIYVAGLMAGTGTS
jgi:TetR/AcrR family transcriptional regulator, transcriptional repressor for nem operon